VNIAREERVAQGARRSRVRSFWEAALLFLAISLTTFRLPNPLVIYYDDLAMARVLTVPFVYLPLFIWALVRALRSPRRAVLIVAVVCAAMGSQHFGALIVSARHALTTYDRQYGWPWRGTPRGRALS